MTKPILYVILDGVGDKPSAERDNKTPLDAASTPNLNKLAERGRMGIVYPVKRGVAPESDAGVFSLLSYDPSRTSLSRGVVEAMGSGVDFRDGDLALRCNFATAEDGQIVDRRAGRNVTSDEARELAEAVNQDSRLRELASFTLKATIGHRCALVFRNNGTKFSDAVSNLDPAYVRKGKITIAKSGVRFPHPIPKCLPLNRAKTAKQTAQLLNRFAAGVQTVLDNHPVNVNRRHRGNLPANFLLMRDAGTKVPKVHTLQEKFGLRAIAVADMPVELGIARVIGMETEVFPPDRSSDGYSKRAEKAVQLANNHDLVYVHLKGPDEPGHDGDFDGKKKAIEDIDVGFFGRLQDSTSSIICVTADHSTPCSAKSHTDDPVPLLVAGPHIESDGSKRFTESYAEKGKLGKIMHGYRILGILKKYSS